MELPILESSTERIPAEAESGAIEEVIRGSCCNSHFAKIRRYEMSCCEQLSMQMSISTAFYFLKLVRYAELQLGSLARNLDFNIFMRH